jgi:competence protein ComFB
VIRNLIEEHVRESYTGVSRRFPDFCGCEVCREDVLVYALNRVPPRYVTTLKGQAVTEVTLEKEQERAVIDVAVIEGIRRVSAAPRCDKAGRGT